MTVFAKVLSVLFMLLSLVYCGVSIVLYTHRTNWREEATKTGKNFAEYKESAEDKIGKLEKNNESLKGEVARFDSNYKELKLKFDESEDDREEKAKKIASLEKVRDEKDTIIKGKDNTISLKDDEIKTQNTKIEKMTARLKESREVQLAAEEKLLIAEDENDNLKTKVEGLHGQLVDTKQSLDVVEAKIRILSEHGIPVESITIGNGTIGPAKPIKSTIIAVKPEANIVMVSVGTDNKVKPGFQFTVYRDEEYIGKVEIEKVFADMSSARILKSFTKREIKEGDRAATRVY